MWNDWLFNHYIVRGTAAGCTALACAMTLRLVRAHLECVRCLFVCLFVCFCFLSFFFSRPFRWRRGLAHRTGSGTITWVRRARARYYRRPQRQRYVIRIILMVRGGGGGGGGGGAPWRRRFRGEGTRRMERIATTAITSRSAVWYRAAEAVLVATSSAPPVERAARIRATTAFRWRGRRSRAPHAVLSRFCLPGEATSDARRRFDRFGRDMRACVLGAHSRPFVFRSMAYTLIPSFISPGSDLLGRVAALARVPAPHSALRRAARRVRGVRGSTRHRHRRVSRVIRTIIACVAHIISVIVA